MEVEIKKMGYREWRLYDDVGYMLYWRKEFYKVGELGGLFLFCW